MSFWFAKRQPTSPDVGLVEPSVGEALMSERPSDILLRWARNGRLRELLPDVDALRGISQLPAHRDDAFEHTLKVVDAIAPTPTRRWAALLHDIAKAPTFIETPDGRSRFFEHDRIGAEMAPEIMSAVGEAPQLIRDAQKLVGLHMRPIAYNPEWTDAAVRRLMEEAEDWRGEAGWRDMIALSRADLAGYLPEPIDRGLWVLDQLEERRRQLLEADRQSDQRERLGPRLPIDGHEIVQLAAREPGPWVGAAKNYLIEEVKIGRLGQEDKEQARELIKRWLETHAGSR